MDIDLGSDNWRIYLDDLKKDDLNKPVAFESVMINIINHVWNNNYKSIFIMVFFTRLMPFISLILLWNDICTITLVLNIV